MSMTITEKILAAHTSAEAVSPGELIDVCVDVIMGHDLSTPLAIQEMEKIGAKKVFDPGKIILVPDHFSPSKDLKAAENSKRMREFAKSQGITHYFEIGEMGIAHALLPEQGLVVPGDVIVGGDSHSCTYGAVGSFATGIGSTDLAAAMLTGTLWLKVPESIKLILRGELRKWVSAKDLILHIIGDIGVDGALYMAMEFTGDAAARMPMSGRLTMVNMVVEAGAKNGIFAVDEITESYLRGRARRDYTVFQSDHNARYADVREYDAASLEPVVAFPHSPGNIRPVSEAADISIDQVVIGSCTNGRIEDLRMAAEVLEGRKVARGVRLIVIPATQDVYAQAMKEGLLEVFLAAPGVVSTPTCGPCVGGHMGVLAKGERAAATTNRNFIGRMGHPESMVYLVNPAVAAASAVKGRIAHPDEVIGKG